MHLTSSPVAWYAVRAGGIVAYVLLTAVVLSGLAISSRRRVERWPRPAIEEVHRFASLTAGSFVAIHVVAVAIDAYLPFSLASLVVPFIADYRPVWVGIGVVAAELMVAIAITNRLRDRRISYATWRKFHYATFAVWAGATLHGLGSGTDRSTAWLVAIEIAAAGAVAGMLAWRVQQPRARAGRDVSGVVVGAAAGAATVVMILALGPLQSHRKPWNAANFTASLSGQISRRTAATRGIVSLAATGRGDQDVIVRADLLIAPAHLVSTAFQMEYLPSGDVCAGTVTRIADDGRGFTARCRMPGGARRFVRVSWPTAAGLALAGGRITSSG
jgi:sulfoxide reductase heme-binding subunit YedZ